MRSPHPWCRLFRRHGRSSRPATVRSQCPSVGTSGRSTERVNDFYFPVSDLLAYRWLPFAGAPFLLGVVTAEQSSDRWLPWPLAVTIAVYGSIFLAAKIGLRFRDRSCLWVSSAMVLLVPIAYVILKFSRRNTWDRILGNLPYPLFWITYSAFRSRTNDGDGLARCDCIHASRALTLSSSIAIFQAGVDLIRYRQRGFGALARSATHGLPDKSPVFVTV